MCQVTLDDGTEYAVNATKLRRHVDWNGEDWSLPGNEITFVGVAYYFWPCCNLHVIYLALCSHISSALLAWSRHRVRLAFHGEGDRRNSPLVNFVLKIRNRGMRTLYLSRLPF